MFKSERGPCVEVFSTGRKQLEEYWKLSGATIQKHFSTDVKSSVFSLEGTTTSTKMQIPKNSKDNLNLMHGFLVLQVYVPKSRDFAFELSVCDMDGSRRRLALSTTWKEVEVTPLHSKIPVDFIRRATWLNLCIDVGSLVKESWLRSSFKSLEGITISGNCHLRRVFTMRSQAMDTTSDDELYGVQCNENIALESVPVYCQLAHGVPHLTQVINFSKVCSFVATLKGVSPESVRPADAEENHSHGVDSNQFNIAFGSKVSRLPTRSAPVREAMGTKGQLHARSVSDVTISRSAQGEIKSQKLDLRKDRITSDPGSGVDDPDNMHRQKDASHSSQASINEDREDFLFANPHPPPKRTSERSATRRHRIRKYTSAALEEKPVDITATDDEVDRILSEMQEKARRRILHPTSESELSDASSRCASEGPEESDCSLNEVIQTLKGTLNHERNEPIHEDRKVYVFASRPSEPPRPRSKRTTKKQQQTSTCQPSSSNGTALHSNDESKSTGEHFPSDHTSIKSSDSGDDHDFDISEMSQIATPVHRVRGNVRKVLPPPSSVIFPRCVLNGGASPRASVTGVHAISRRSLREIPGEEIRRSGGDKPYRPMKYNDDDDLTESYERHMLLKIQNDSLDAADSADENDDRNFSQSRSRPAYGNDDTDSSDDTSTLKSPKYNRNPLHNYSEEIRKFQDNPGQSNNSRDWGTMSIFGTSLIVSTDMSVFEHNNYSARNGEVNQSSRRDTDNDAQNDDLDLCYDPVLRKFYDPQTLKYYELITPS